MPKKKARSERKRFNKGQGDWQGEGSQYDKPEKYTQKGIQFTGDRPKDGPVNRRRKKKKKG
ncbi:hypothetical protein [Poriferisphaera sp. WC338]|uniref:hypothetical protein n=1 Tax=Poriferisphaera sp. WC338 TaxID=3425129 RepID=UPI003D81BD99